jgi:hypothetical protein
MALLYCGLSLGSLGVCLGGAAHVELRQALTVFQGGRDGKES